MTETCLSPETSREERLQLCWRHGREVDHSRRTRFIVSSHSVFLSVSVLGVGNSLRRD